MENKGSLLNILGENVIEKKEDDEEQISSKDDDIEYIDDLEDPFFTKNTLSYLTNTYSVNDCESFELKDLEEFIFNILDNLYKNNEILNKSPKELIKNDDYVNSMFIDLLKKLMSEKLNSYSKMPNKYGIIFICFAEYFNFDYNMLYNKMHKKIQNNIKLSLIGIIGKDSFDSYCKKVNNMEKDTQTAKFIRLWEL